MRRNILNYALILSIFISLCGCNDNSRVDEPLQDDTSGEAYVATDTLNAFFLSDVEDIMEFKPEQYPEQTPELFYYMYGSLFAPSGPCEVDCYLAKKYEYADTVGVPVKWHIKALAECEATFVPTDFMEFDKLSPWYEIEVPSDGCLEYLHDWFKITVNDKGVHVIFRDAYNPEKDKVLDSRYLKVVLEGVSSLGKYFETEGVIRQHFTSSEGGFGRGDDYYVFYCDTTVSCGAHDFEIVSKYSPERYEKLYHHPNTNTDWTQNPDNKGIWDVYEILSPLPFEWRQWNEKFIKGYKLHIEANFPMLKTYSLSWTELEILPTPGDIHMRVTIQPNESPYPRAIRVGASGHMSIDQHSYLPDGSSEWVPTADFDLGLFYIYQDGKK